MADSSSDGGLINQLAHPQVFNPMAAQQAASQTAQGIWANRLAQAQQLSGQAQLDATAADGTYSPDQYRANLKAAGPNAALAAQSGLTSNQALSTDQLNQAFKKTDYMAKTAGGVLADPGFDYSDASMMRLLGQGSADGVLTIPEITRQLATMPPDAAGRQQWVQQHQNQALSQQQQLELRYGRPVTADDGQVVRGGTQSMQTGALNVPGAPPVPSGQGVQKQTGPDSNAALVPMVDNDPQSPTYGQSFKVPRSALPGAPGVVSPPASPLGTGRPPAALRNPNAATAPAAPAAPGPAPPVAGAAPPVSTPPGSATPATAPATPAAPAAGSSVPPGAVPPGAVPTGLAPGTAEEMQGSVTHAVEARGLANSYQTRIQPIEGALTALAGADTGKGGETLNTIRAYTQDVAPSFIQRMLPSSLTDPKSRIAFEEANKYLTGMAINAPGGARSNAGQEAAGAATPSVHISNEAAQLVARAALAQQRLTQAGTLAFNQSGQPAQSYDRFMNNWNTSADPRAFVADKMSPNERADLTTSLGGVGSPAYQKFKQSYQQGVATGVIPNHAAQ